MLRAEQADMIFNVNVIQTIKDTIVRTLVLCKWSQVNVDLF